LRVAGFVADSARAGLELLDRLNGPGRTVLVAPGDDGPLVGAVVDPTSSPQVGVARHAGGSFAVLDGEVLPADPLASPLVGDAAARFVLDRFLERGADELYTSRVSGVAAIWDAGAGRLQLLRDLAGEGIVYTSRRDQATLWSTDLNGLTAAGVPFAIDPLGVSTFLTIGTVPPPRSLLRGVDVLPSGWGAVLAPGQPARWCWHARWTSKPALRLEPDERSRLLGEAIVRSVGRRVAGSERPAVLLSGGVDSAVIAAVTSRLCDRQVQSITLDYSDHDGRFAEGQRAAAVAAHLGLSHHRETVTPGDLERGFEAAVAGFQEPMSYGIHTFKIGALAGMGVDVVLSGCGPDNWYDLGRLSLAATGLWMMPPRLRDAAVHALEPAARVDDRFRMLSMLVRNGEVVEWTPIEVRRALLGAPNADAAASDLIDLLTRRVREYHGEPVRHRWGFVNCQHIEPELPQKWDRNWSRTFGLPIRQPYWDPDVIGLANRIGRRDQGKHNLRRFAATLLPEEFARSPKLGQELPIGQWFQGPLQAFVRDRLAPAEVDRTGFLDPTVVTKLVDEHLSGAATWTWTLFMLMTIVEWSRQHSLAPA